MKKEDLWILFLALALVAGILLTLLFSGNKSKHGYGANLKMQVFKPDVTVYT